MTKSSEKKILRNGFLITPFRSIPNGNLLIKDGKFSKVGKIQTNSSTPGTKVYDLQGNYIVPGFLDMHLHGGGGGDVMDADLQSLEKMSKIHARHGTTSIVPTTTTAPLPKIEDALDIIEDFMENSSNNGAGARVLGAHIEGPYLNKEQAGAQNPEHLRIPKDESYLQLLRNYGEVIMRFSAAPELEGGLELGRRLVEREILASIAHSNATYQEVQEAVEAGYSHCTHMFSGMSNLRRSEGYRISGLVESTLLMDELTTELITDGHHLPPSLINLSIKAKGLNRLALVTDSMRAAGLGPGRYEIGGLETVVESDKNEKFELASQDSNYVAKLPDRTAFAGSVATMDRLINVMIKKIGLSLKESVKLATYNPAHFLGIDDSYGIIAPGRHADLTVLDENFKVIRAMKNGKWLNLNFS